MNINKVMLMGRLTSDPELKMSASGIPNVRFSVAVNRRFAKQGEDRPTADFIPCTAFRQTAEFVSKYQSLVSIQKSQSDATSRKRMPRCDFTISES